jgi:hypothetical protein
MHFDASAETVPCVLAGEAYIKLAVSQKALAWFIRTSCSCMQVFVRVIKCRECWRTPWYDD